MSFHALPITALPSDESIRNVMHSEGAWILVFQPHKVQHQPYISDWVQAMEYGLMDGRPYSPQTVKAYSEYVKGLFKTYEEVSIATLKAVLLSVPVKHFAKRHKIYQAMNSFAKYLIREELLKKEYLEQAKAFKPRRHLPVKKTVVNEKEIEALLAQATKPMDRLIVILLSATGLRVTEAASLQLEDLNLESRILTVRLAKWGKSRRVGMTQTLVDNIQAYLQVRPKVSHPYLFMNKRGEPLDRFGIRIRLEKLGKKADVHVTPHSLRRAFVTLNANKGRPLPMLQIACGHSNITTTRSYCMTTEEETIEAMQQWN